MASILMQDIQYRDNPPIPLKLHYEVYMHTYLIHIPIPLFADFFLLV